jgi:hypothetical protein
VRAAARESRATPRRTSRLLPIALVLAGAACIQVVQTAPDMEPEPQTPDPLVSMEPPKLVPTEAPGLFAAPALDPTLYYYEPDELWYRYSYRRWFQAFRWDGAWFVPERVPDVVKARVPEETPKTLKEQIRTLDKKLEELDRDERLKQLEKKMEELDKQEAQPQPEKPKAAPPPGPAGSSQPR